MAPRFSNLQKLNLPPILAVSVNGLSKSTQVEGESPGAAQLHVSGHPHKGISLLIKDVLQGVETKAYVWK